MEGYALFVVFDDKMGQFLGQCLLNEGTCSQLLRAQRGRERGACKNVHNYVYTAKLVKLVNTLL